MQSVEAATSAGGGVQTNPRPSLHKATKRASSQAKAEAAMKAGPPPLIVFMLLGGCGALMLLWLASLGDDSSLATRSSRYKPYVTRSTALAPWLPTTRYGKGRNGSAASGAAAHHAPTHGDGFARRRPCVSSRRNLSSGNSTMRRGELSERKSPKPLQQRTAQAGTASDADDRAHNVTWREGSRHGSRKR